ncbi:hypothetical protein EBS57_10135, partial [bacterium]|nr:hypothetical protein [bacterium]
AGSSNAFGVNSATTLSNGVVLDLNNFNNSIGGLNGNGSVTLGSANLTLGGGGQTGTFGGSISGTGGLYKTFAGRQTLTGSNTYSGVTRVDGGILTLAGTNGSAIYSDGRNGKLIIGGNGNGYYGIFNMVEIGAARQLGANVDLEFDVNVPYSYLALMGNNLEIGNLTMNGSRSDWAVIENSEGVYGLSTGAYSKASFTINIRDTWANGNVNTGTGAGTLELVKKGSGTLTIQGANVTHTGGTKIMEGRLVSQGASIGGSGSASQVFINSNAVLQYNLTNAPGYAYGTRQKGATISGAGTLEKTGQGMLIFGGSGQVNIAMDAGSWINLREGTIKAHDNVQANWDNNKASLFVNTNATFSQVEGNVTVGALSGGGLIELGYSWPNFQPVMRIGYGDASSEFSGTMRDMTAYGGRGIVTKIGKGTQTFSGTNNAITGNLTVNDGIINFGNTGSFTANALWVGNVNGSRGRVEVGNGNVITTLNNADRVGVVLGDNGGTGALY